MPLVLSSIPDEDFSISSPFPRAEIIASGLLSEMESLDAVRAMQNDAYLKLLRWLQDQLSMRYCFPFSVLLFFG